MNDLISCRHRIWHGVGVWVGMHLLQCDPGLVSLLPFQLIHHIRAAVGFMWEPLEHRALPAKSDCRACSWLQFYQ